MTCQVELISKNKFLEAVWDKNVKAFIAYINNLTAKIIILLAKKSSIFLLLVEKVLILTKYLDFADFFSKKSIKVLFKYNRVNKYVIEFKKKQATIL